MILTALLALSPCVSSFTQQHHSPTTYRRELVVPTAFNNFLSATVLVSPVKSDAEIKAVSKFFIEAFFDRSPDTSKAALASLERDAYADWVKRCVGQQAAMRNNRNENLRASETPSLMSSLRSSFPLTILKPLLTPPPSSSPHDTPLNLSPPKTFLPCVPDLVQRNKKEEEGVRCCLWPRSLGELLGVPPWRRTLTAGAVTLIAFVVVVCCCCRGDDRRQRLTALQEMLFLTPQALSPLSFSFFLHVSSLFGIS